MVLIDYFKNINSKLVYLFCEHKVLNLNSKLFENLNHKQTLRNSTNISMSIHDVGTISLDA